MRVLRCHSFSLHKIWQYAITQCSLANPRMNSAFIPTPTGAATNRQPQFSSTRFVSLFVAYIGSWTAVQRNPPCAMAPWWSLVLTHETIRGWWGWGSSWPALLSNSSQEKTIWKPPKLKVNLIKPCKCLEILEAPWCSCAATSIWSAATTPSWPWAGVRHHDNILFISVWPFFFFKFQSFLDLHLVQPNFFSQN